MRKRADSMARFIAKATFAGLLFSGTILVSSLPLAAEGIPRVADVTDPPPDTTLIVSGVRKLIQQDHILHPDIDDKMSERAFDLFLRQVDPLKMYFLQSDINDFLPFRDKLDDFLKLNNVKFGYEVYKRYLFRLDQWMPYIHEQIDAPHDFTVNESIIADAKEIGWAKDEAELKDRIRKTVKLNILSLKADNKTETEIRETLHKRYRTLYKARTQTDVDELLEMYLSSMTRSLDPHSTYMSPREQKDFGVHLKLEFTGIGATLRPEDGQTIVENIVLGGAADRDGRLKAGDHIVGVQQENGSTVIDTVDMKLQDVVDQIRGPKGSKIRLHVKPQGTGSTVVYEITRDLIKLEDEAARGEIIEHSSTPDGKKYRIGYINLPSFYLDMDAHRRNARDYRSTRRDLSRIIEDFKQKGIDAIVLDLSKNGGGSLIEAISVTGLFIERGPVVQVKSFDSNVESHADTDPSILWAGPLVVKNSQLSASASEIFAGAIQDYNRGLIVGDPKSHGKGTVQTLIDVAERLGLSKSYGGMKLTIQQFYLPSGKSTQLDGVASDVIIPSITAKLNISESDLDYPIPADKIPAQPHKDYRMVSPKLKVDLQAKSSERVSLNSEFQKLLARIDSFMKQKEEKEISLNEAEYMARRKELDAEKIEEEQLTEDRTKGKDKIFNDNFYNQEVLSITTDYIELLNGNVDAQARRGISATTALPAK